MTIDKIVAVVVTYNRKYLLLRTISSLKDQSHQIDEIIIIDNASTDGTADLFKDQTNDNITPIKYYRMEKNSGGAGGFHEGLKKAVQAGAKWIWVMDDDVAPEKDCLQEMLKWRSISHCIHPRRVFNDGTDYILEENIDIYTGASSPLRGKSFQNGKEYYFSNVACFEGMLVSADIVEKVGFPSSNYFITSDDHLFGLKASLHTNIIYLHNAIIRKLIDNRESPLAPWKIYYTVRNKFFLARDISEYLNLNVKFSKKFILILSFLINTLGWMKLGPRHGVAASRGFCKGLFYYIKARSPKEKSAEPPEK
ncbi:glycosyltransferase family 2 protein [Thalassospira mesophila]|uniref:glycosyltransferase family 2 protein n=1 Tax=Thalassospira mesophila TaxID=1293891 RepID=UPI000A1F0279|nr:glycosyltransferase family 2 protein [Thalassospira mesophila]